MIKDNFFKKEISLRYIFYNYIELCLRNTSINLKNDYHYYFVKKINDIKNIVERIIEDKNSRTIALTEKLLCNCTHCINSDDPEIYSIGVKQAVCQKSKETVVFGKVKINISNLTNPMINRQSERIRYSSTP